MGGEFLVPEKLRKETSEAIGDKLIIKDFERDESLEKDILRAADDFWYNIISRNFISGPITVVFRCRFAFQETNRIFFTFSAKNLSILPLI